MSVEKINKSVKLDIKEALKNAMPQIFEDNKVNLNELKALLSGEIIEKEDDRFYFNWAGKNELFRLIQAPAYSTLKADKKKSVDFDNTENLVIVGENLETLKLLLKPYFNRVKMIYIDPPYNTGKDFIYKDNFKEPLKDYLEKTGQIDSEGSKLTTNTEASGRYHSDWLDFMYSRLFLAKSLLREDGVIFVSIDDNEVHHLRMIMDEIFGEENFIGTIIWKNKFGAGAQNKGIIGMHEYILCYANNFTIIESIEIPYSDKIRGMFNKKDENFDKFGPYATWPLETTSMEDRPNLRFPISYKGEKIWPKKQWLWSKERVEEALSKNLLVFSKTRNKWSVRFKRYLRDPEGKEREGKPISIFDGPYTQEGTKEINEIFGKQVFTFPKPSSLIAKLLEFSINKGKENNDVILDFFAGSGPTGHAVWKLNKRNIKNNKKFILVQLEEPVDDKTEAGKNALKLGLKTVADICIERLKRVSDEYRKEKTLFGKQDFGFKVFKLDKSNFNLKDEFEIPEDKDAKELKKKYLDWLGIWVKEPLVAGWKPLDIVYEVMLKEGFDLNSQIEEMKIKSNNFLHVVDKKGEQEFYISLDDKINKSTIEEVRTAIYKGKTFVFLDKALTDNDKINLKAFVRVKVI